MRTVIVFLIVFYQRWIRSCLKPSCRFYPSCSEYAIMAIEQLGLRKGLYLVCCRLVRCHPWSLGGYDPVIPNKEEKH